MSSIDDLADQLARDTIEASRRLDRPNLIDEIAKILEASSSKMHESFMTYIRVHLSEARARAFLADREADAAAKAGKSAPEKAPSQTPAQAQPAPGAAPRDGHG